MAWPKIKNIIILILLGANLCLLTFTVDRAIKARRVEDQARANAIAFLQEDGIQVDEGQIPHTMDLPPQTVVRDTAGERELAVRLLGEDVVEESRGAEVFRYFNGKGSIQFHSNGEFSARFEPRAIPVGESDLEEHGRQLLEKLGIQGELSEQEEDDGAQRLTYREYWEGVPLLNCSVTLVYEAGDLVNVTGGRRLPGLPKEDTEAQTITVATALMKFYTGMTAPGDVFTSITAITPGYVLGSALSGPIPLVPVWHLTTDVGSYQLDLTTGVPTRIAG